MIPVCMVQNIAQPQRNPTPGPNASLRNTYTPPAFGYADANSAAISAPNKVRSPDTSQTTYTVLTDDTAPVITDGCTKIEAPMMIPTTSAVAWRSVMGRARAGGFAMGVIIVANRRYSIVDVLRPSNRLAALVARHHARRDGAGQHHRR